MQVVLRVWRDGPVLHLVPGEFVLGRSQDCHIRLPQNPVSRRHCCLTVARTGPLFGTSGAGTTRV
jgi:FOG: FHA domain